MDGSQTKYATLFRAEPDDVIVNKIWARNGSVAVALETFPMVIAVRVAAAMPVPTCPYCNGTNGHSEWLRTRVNMWVKVLQNADCPAQLPLGAVWPFWYSAGRSFP